MAQKQWDTFVEEHPQAPGFTAAVRSSLPKELQFDSNNKKLPTPYGLFREWLKRTLQGDWASTPIKGVGFAVRVATKEDAALIAKKFRTGGGPKQTPVGPKMFSIDYRDSSYGTLAKELGYAVQVRGDRGA